MSAYPEADEKPDTSRKNPLSQKVAASLAAVVAVPVAWHWVDASSPDDPLFIAAGMLLGVPLMMLILWVASRTSGVNE